jgi:hypothetical protein
MYVSLETVKQYVDENHPVIVLVQAWAQRYMTLEDWKEDSDDGHYVIVIGHYGYIIVFQDPASFRRTWMTEEEFIARWHDVDPRTQEKFDRFAMVLLGKQPAKVCWNTWIKDTIVAALSDGLCNRSYKGLFCYPYRIEEQGQGKSYRLRYSSPAPFVILQSKIYSRIESGRGKSDSAR